MIRRQRSRERGVTLMEMLVVVAIVSVVFIMSYSLLEDAVRTSLFLEEHTDLPVFSQAAINTIQRELMQARTVFDGTVGSPGPGYFAALNTAALKYPMVSNKSLLPVANSAGQLVPDTATQFVGNCLLIARQLEPAPIKLANGSFLMVDRYKFELFYLTNRTTKRFSTADHFVDIIQAKSDTYADYFQLDQWQNQTTPPTNADKVTVNTALRTWVDTRTGIADPILRAWDPGQVVASAIYNINADGTFTGPVAGPSISLPNAVSLVPGMSGGRVVGKMDYSVGFRPTSTTTWPIRDAVPKYAVYNSSTPDYPAGLEFLIVGPSGSQRILTRLVLIASYGKNFDSREATVITSY